ncbi:MAG TPA: succinyl-diaminopimelate desuccinylase [Acidimicrobiales bacterium]|nr:succinyl-diaminopimelate desuccinylase [Acidimicrobiales bacterium]
MAPKGGPADDLLELTAELVAVPSVSRDEARLAGFVESELRRSAHLEVERIGDSVVARSQLGRPARVLLAGHLDTVPGSANASARVDGDAVTGLGAVDMKGGLAVMLHLAPLLEAAAVDVTFVFYACEEIERTANALAALARDRPELLAADAAVLGEPTAGVVEAGCQGTMRAEITVTGRRAHTARPYTGVNAVHRLAAVLPVLQGYRSRQVEIDGCEYAEQLQAVRVSGGVATNVVPDEATLTVNYRFAPDRSSPEAEQELRRMFEPALDAGRGDRLTVVDEAAGATPGLTHPLLAKLVAASGRAPRAKVGWTDVATLAAIGIPATNFGPGDPMLAHTADERVTRGELEHVHGVLSALLGVG